MHLIKLGLYLVCDQTLATQSGDTAIIFDYFVDGFYGHVLLVKNCMCNCILS